jgi:hypothetical protein
METRIGRFNRGDVHNKTSRKQSGQPGREPNADPPWIGDGSLLCKCLQCSSDNRCFLLSLLRQGNLAVVVKKVPCC